MAKLGLKIFSDSSYFLANLAPLIEGETKLKIRNIKSLK